MQIDDDGQRVLRGPRKAEQRRKMVIDFLQFSKDGRMTDVLRKETPCPRPRWGIGQAYPHRSRTDISYDGHKFAIFFDVCRCFI